MERDQVAGLAAELNAQIRLIERVQERLESRVNLGFDSPAQLDSIAYQIHNVYCAAEDLLKLVAQAFENSVSGAEWHRSILLRLSQPVQGIRPALLSEETFDVMNRLRGFRHFIRHAYGADIEITQLNSNLDLAEKLRSLLPLDVENFFLCLTRDEG
jgi:uncharacterized protein YutE (UPF0331/DUF86 family)